MFLIFYALRRDKGTACRKQAGEYRPPRPRSRLQQAFELGGDGVFGNRADDLIDHLALFEEK